MSISINVTIDERDFLDAVVASSAEDAMQAILAIDLAIGDAGFTEDLICRLAQSLRGDLTEADWRSLVGSLAAAPAHTGADRRGS